MKEMATHADGPSGGGWLEFDAPLELMTWGRNVYIVLFLEDHLDRAAAEARTRRVEGRIDQVEVNLGINKADVARAPFLYVGTTLRRRLGARAGDVVTCRLRPADPDHVPMPDDVRTALEAVGRLQAFDSQRPAARRRLLQPVDDASRPATRQRRIAALISALPPG